VGPATECGFADALRDALIEQGHSGWVDAHKTAGHTTMNPYVVRFHLDPEVQNNGGEWIVQPGSPLWPAWVRAMRGPMRFRFPLLDTEEIANQIRMGG
ncbi:hypothetical protein, partial [Candidatus Magnetobacterium casense]|uniref:hypothetical protein n=1 Tax=Candidatus Magnetobacterium casense TaxID=1455061 RepID=UPI001C44EEF5